MLFIPLEKIDIKQRLVYGTIAAEEPDRVGEILDYASSKPAFQKWSEDQHKASGGKSYGNVRAMHNRAASGKVAQPLHFDDELKKISACVYVSDDADWQKIQDGVFTGFSPGGGYAKVWQDGKHKRYTPVIVELSLVDVPCQPSATFACIKADGTEELRKFKNTDDLGDIEQGFRSKDGRFFKAKIGAEKWNKFLDEMAKMREEAETAVTHPALEALAKAEETVSELEEEDEEDEEEDKKKAAEKTVKVTLKKAADYDLQKGFTAIAALSETIASLNLLQEMCEGAPPEITALVKIITDIVAAEGEELGAAIADKTVDLPRATADVLIKLIGVDHPTMKKIKVIEPVVTPPADDELKKSLDAVTSELAQERKVTGELTDGLTKLTKRLEVIERQPMPVRGPLRAVDRSTERLLPAPELRKDRTAHDDTLRMPPGLSPQDQRVWMHANQPKK